MALLDRFDDPDNLTTADIPYTAFGELSVESKTPQVAPGNQTIINLGELRAKIRPGERFVFTGDMQSGSSDTNISITWVERI